MGTGLKKWSPRTFWGRRVAAANSVIGIAEVLLAKRVPGPQTASRFRKISCLTARSSKTASIASSARGGVGDTADDGDPAEDGFRRLLQLPFLDELPHRPLDALHSSRQGLSRSIVQQNLNPGLGAHLGDPAAHQPGPHDQHLFDFHGLSPVL